MYKYLYIRNIEQNRQHQTVETASKVAYVVKNEEQSEIK